MNLRDAPHFSGDGLSALPPSHFSSRVTTKILSEAIAHLTQESPRALMDLTLRLHGGVPVAPARLLVLGANDDRSSTPADVKATASLYGVPALVLPGLAHMLMLERDWETAARPLLAWLKGSG